MSFNKNTLRYLYNNGWKFLPITLIAGIALAFSGNLSGAVHFFFDMELNASSVWNIYAHFSLLTSRSWLVGILTAIILLFEISLLYGILDRHLRVGTFSYKKPLVSLNDTVMTTVPIVFASMILLELCAFLTSAVILLVAKTALIMTLPISIAVTILIFTLMIFAIVEFILIIPAMQIVGYPFKDAFIFSTKLLSGKVKKIVFDFTLLIISSVLISWLFSLLFDGLILTLCVDTILYTFMLMYIPIYSMLVFYELTNEQRRDINQNKKSYLI